jgi:hypothetical protein
MNIKFIFIPALVVLAAAAVYLAIPKNSQPFVSDLITIATPLSGGVVQSPLEIKGEARGYWFFEASFPVKLLDEQGNILAQAPAQAQGEWMTEEFVPYSVVLVFEINKDQKGTLVLQRDNPSGMPENDQEVRIPVNLKKSGKLVDLYYYNPALDQDETGNILCSRQGLTKVQRNIPITQTPIQDTIKLLLKGELTSAEKSLGITTEYPLQGLSLTAASLNNGVLTLTFNDPEYKTGGGSCRVGILWFQIEATAKQFPEVKQVKFMSEELFQP